MTCNYTIGFHSLGIVGDIVRQIDIQASRLSNQTIHTNLIAHFGCVNETRVFKQCPVRPSRNDYPTTTIIRTIVFVKNDFQVDQIIIKRSASGQDQTKFRICTISTDFITGRGRGIHTCKGGVHLTRQPVSRFTHSLVHNFRLLLRPVDVINLEIEIIRLVNNKGSLGIGQRFRRIHIIVFGVWSNSNPADRVNLDGIAYVFNITFVITIGEVSVNVRLIQVLK